MLWKKLKLYVMKDTWKISMQHTLLKNIWRSREEAKLTLWIGSRENILRTLKFIALSSLNLGFKKLIMFVENNLYKSYIKNKCHALLKIRNF